MGKTISILCVHGVGHGDADPTLRPRWEKAIREGLTAANPYLQEAEIDIEFLAYDALFDDAQHSFGTYAAALAKLIASAASCGIGGLFRKERGLFDIPTEMRWTAGMVAQWISDEKLRNRAKDLFLQKLTARDYNVVCAHSLGSLISYDAFLRHPETAREKYFVTLGSQIANVCVREAFAGYLKPLVHAKMWYHLYNPCDHAFTAEVSIPSPNLQEVITRFDIPDDALNHDAVWYLRDRNTRDTVWRNISGAGAPESQARSLSAFRVVSAKPKRRALLVGINDYPNPANRLDGCVNDVYLMSSVLQECGFGPESIRIVLNDRATAAGILDRLHWLLDGVKDGDERVLFYSGHGAQMPVYGPTEEVDHLDECLVPHDFDWSPEHAVTDKQFLEMYSQLPYDSRFVAVFDCCHSGGMTREGGRKIRGLTPPDDIRHRALRWNAEFQMWEDRPLAVPNRSLSEEKDGVNYVGSGGDTYRFGRAVSLRGLPRSRYDAVRRAIGHHGPYLPVILEACQEGEPSYEYHHGAQSYGAFTFSLAAELRASRNRNRNPTFIELMSKVRSRLKTLKFEQTPNLVGAKAILGQQIPWTRKTSTVQTRRSRQ